MSVLWSGLLESREVFRGIVDVLPHEYEREQQSTAGSGGDGVVNHPESLVKGIEEPRRLLVPNREQVGLAIPDREVVGGDVPVEQPQLLVLDAHGSPSVGAHEVDSRDAVDPTVGEASGVTSFGTPDATSGGVS